MKSGFATLLVLAATQAALAQPAAPPPPSAFFTSPPGSPVPPPPAGPFPIQGELAADPAFPLLAEEHAPAPQPAGRRAWFDADYLVWWLKPTPNNSILVTTGPLANPVPGSLGPGGPGSVILFGGSPLNSNAVSGVRLSAGFWLDPEQTFAVEGRGFVLPTTSSGAVVAGNSTGNPFLAIPFHDVNLATPGEAAAPFSSNLVRTGSMDLSARESLWGAEGNLLYTLCPGFACNVRCLAGYRHLDLQEELTLQQALTPLGAGGVTFNGVPVPVPGSVGVVDSFRTHNQFNGGQLGMQGNLVRGRWFAQLTGKVALGSTHEEIDIAGASSLLAPGLAPVTVPGGLFAQRTNIGQFSSDRFAVVPEGELRIGYRCGRHLTASLGYTFLYWSSVARPGDQVDRAVNSSQVPTLGTGGALNGPSNPSPLLQTTDFWAQGLSFSLGWLY